MWQLLGTLYQIAIGTAGCAGRLSQHAATIKKEDKEMSNKRLTTRNGAPVVDNQNVITAGPRGRCYCRMSGFWRSWPILTGK